MLTDPDKASLSGKAERLGYWPIIGGIQSQLNPVMWWDFLCQTGSWDPDAVFLLDGVVHGFRMIDKFGRVQPHCNDNYGSCWSVQTFEKLNRLICEELAEGKLSISPGVPVFTLLGQW